MERLFTNARIVTPEGIVTGSLSVADGKITGIYEGLLPTRGTENVDCAGMVLFPGVIDPHVHFREPAPNEREDFGSGTRSAAAGGVTCVIDHPLDVPPVLDAASYDAKLEAIAPKAYIDYGLWGGLTENNLSSLNELQEKGVLAFKAFLCASDPLFPMIRDGALYAAMQAIAQMDGLIGLHAENNEIIAYNRAHRDPGAPWDCETHGRLRPVIAEQEAISRAILLAQAAGVRLHILHMGIFEGARLIKQAKARGVRVTAETCPHYLVLDETLFARMGPNAKCCPPLRDRAHADKLWEGVFDGTIDFIVSDHSPYTEEEKNSGYGDTASAPPGLTGIQTGLQVMLSEGHHKRGLSLEKLAKLMSTNAAVLFGLYGRKGALEVGFDADFTLIDLERVWTVRKEELYYKNQNSAFAGFSGKGKPVATYVRGRMVYSEAAGFVQGPGYGRLLSRKSRH